MSSIADALKKAQQNRDRLRSGESLGALKPEALPAEPSLASVVLHRSAAGKDPGKAPKAAPPAADAINKPTPLADAVRLAPAAAPPSVRAQQQAAQSIVEDYRSKHQLNLPAAMVVYHERAGPIAEHYRKMRDSLMAANLRREPRILVLTSAMPGEGKTTTLMNLGLALVEIRANRVLLVDGCLHRVGGSGRPTLTDLLRLHGAPGLAQWLALPGEDAEASIKATPWHHLYALPAGTRTTAAAATELLKSPALGQCFRALRARFDWVLIDAPAALALPDAGLFGGSSDAIHLAVALHHTACEKVQTTIRRLKSMNLPLKSCILTRA